MPLYYPILHLWVRYRQVLKVDRAIRRQDRAGISIENISEPVWVPDVWVVIAKLVWIFVSYRMIAKLVAISARYRTWDNEMKFLGGICYDK